MQNAKYRIQNTKYKIQNTKYKIQNTKYRISNKKYLSRRVCSSRCCWKYPSRLNLSTSLQNKIKQFPLSPQNFFGRNKNNIYGTKSQGVYSICDRWNNNFPLGSFYIDSYPGSGGSAICFSDSVFAASVIHPPES